VTQLELSKALGFDYYTFISSVESGVSELPSEHLATWAKTLGAPVDEFAKNLMRHYDPHLFDALFG
jgi:hypothetical protein